LTKIGKRALKRFLEVVSTSLKKARFHLGEGVGSYFNFSKEGGILDFILSPIIIAQSLKQQKVLFLQRSHSNLPLVCGWD